MSKSKDLNQYITTIKDTKPSAEAKFKSTAEDGSVTETVASQEYVAEHADTELDVVSQIDGLKDRLARVVTEEVSEDLDAVMEDAEVEFSQKTATDATSPMTHVPNGYDGTAPSTQEMSETAMLVLAIQKLCDKIDEMQNFNPVIHVPAPVIHVTMPETRRTVTKTVERDDKNLITNVREDIEEKPTGKPLVEVVQPDPETKPKRKKGSSK